MTNMAMVDRFDKGDTTALIVASESSIVDPEAGQVSVSNQNT